MSNESYEDRAARFRQDIEAAMISDSNGRIAKLAEKYDLEPRYVTTVIAHTYLKVAVEAILQRVDCKREHIEDCYDYVCTVVEAAAREAQFERGDFDNRDGGQES